MRVKLSDSDLIYLGGAAILSGMVPTRDPEEAFEDALGRAAGLLEKHQAKWKDVEEQRRAEMREFSEIVKQVRRENKTRRGRRRLSRAPRPRRAQKR